MNRLRAKGPAAAAGTVTIRQVAAEAGVSVATVSRVVSQQDGVGNRVRARVLRAVRRLNYQPNRLAQGLRRARSRKVIGVIIPDLQNPFFTSVIHGVESVLYDAGYTLLLGHSDSLASRERTHLAVMRGEAVSGLILVPANEPGTDYSPLKASKIPVVAIDRNPSGLAVDLVTTNNREGVRAAVCHLLSHGYEEIAFINGPRDLDLARERQGGYIDALKVVGLAVRESWIIHSDFRQEGGRAVMNRFLDLRRPPRAVVVANNLMTLGALQAIHERGVRAPEDVAIVGFDDMPWAASLNPPLTAVAQPMEELGATAARLLLERLKEPRRPAKWVVMPTELRIRASCGCPGRAGTEIPPTRESETLAAAKP